MNIIYNANDNDIQRDRCVKEMQSILSQGIHIYHYSIESRSRIKKVLWMDSNLNRICLNNIRTSIHNSSVHIPYGLYLRDISVIRKGNDSYYFNKSFSIPPQELCFTIIGTETSISVEFISEETRNWFYDRFNLLINKNSSLIELQNRLRLNNIVHSKDHIDISMQMETSLRRGIDVKYHFNSKIKDVLLYYKPSTKTISLLSQDRYYFGLGKRKETNMSLLDIADIKTGANSINFIETTSTDKSNQCATIISTENVFDIEFQNKLNRDNFIIKFKIFVNYSQSINRKFSSLDSEV